MSVRTETYSARPRVRPRRVERALLARALAAQMLVRRVREKLDRDAERHDDRDLCVNHRVGPASKASPSASRELDKIPDGFGQKIRGVAATVLVTARTCDGREAIQ